MRSAKELHLGEEAVGGLSAGILGTIVGYPLDLIKTRLQTGSTKSTSSGQQHSILSVGKGIVRSEGIGALYKGVGPPLISLSILNTTTFIQYAYFRELYQANPGWDIRNFLAGVSCSPFAGIVSTVENFTKTQMQLDNVRQSKRKYTGSWDCFRTLIRRHDFRIVYTGHFVNTIREVSFIGPYFFFYEGLRETFIRKQHELRQEQQYQYWAYPSFVTNVKLAIPIAGGLSGALSWFISFPLDCIRAGVQGQSMPPQKGAFRVCRELILTKGIRGLYAGSSASIVRAFLVSGSRFSAYEGALQILRGGRNYEKHSD